MYQEKYDKMTNIITIIIVIIVFLLLIIFKIIPDLKAIRGSSDTYINYDKYDTVVGIKINTNTDFLLVITDNKVQNIIFLSSNSLCLYNKNIEGNTISNSLANVVNILRNNNVLLNELTLIKYQKNSSYNDVKQILANNLTLQEKESTYQLLAVEYNIKSYQDNTEQLQAIEAYSKELTRKYKNDKILKETLKKQTKEELQKAANNVYSKLEKYAKNVENQEIYSTSLIITDIPANQDLTLYPSVDSWYYIKNHQVYAYINFKTTSNNYDFCYNGSIYNMKEGKCS